MHTTTATTEMEMSRIKWFLAPLAVILLLAVAVGLFTRETPRAAPGIATETIQPPTVDELLRLVNEERAKVGVAPLVIDERLNMSAQYKAQDLLSRNYFAHTDPETGKNNGLDYAESLGMDIACSNVSENITWNTRVNDSKSAVNAWVKSGPHYKAMINPEYTLTGFGIADTKIVQHFCIAR